MGEQRSEEANDPQITSCYCHLKVRRRSSLGGLCNKDMWGHNKTLLRDKAISQDGDCVQDNLCKERK